MTHPGQPHDTFFKAIFSHPEAAATALRRVLPAALVERIDWSALEPVPTEAVDAELGASRADLMFRAPLAGTAVWFTLMLEHQSSVARRMPLRFLSYMLPVWRAAERDLAAHEPLPFIVPVVVYHGVRRWTAPLAFEEMFAVPEALEDVLRPHVPTFRLVLDDLRRTGPLEGTAGMALAIVGLTLLKHAPHDAALRPVLERLVSQLAAVARMAHGELYFAQIARYVFDVSDESAPAIRDALVRTVPPEMQEVAMTAGDQLRAEGREEGRAEGREEGRAEGREEGRAEGRAEALRVAMLKMIQLKFGPPDAATARRVQAADADTLEGWTERILDVERLADLFA